MHVAGIGTLSERDIRRGVVNPLPGGSSLTLRRPCKVHVAGIGTLSERDIRRGVVNPLPGGSSLTLRRPLATIHIRSKVQKPVHGIVPDWA